MKVKNIRMKAVGIMAAGALAVGCIPAVSVRAEDVNVGGTAVTREVTGTFTVTDEDLADMGYGPMVSVPLGIGLSYNSSLSKYSGSGTIYGYGVINAGKHISIEIDSENDKHGKIYNASNVDCASHGSGYSTGMSKEAWSVAECRANLEAKKAGGTIPNIGEVDVSVSKNYFIPTGTGDYKTYIPLKIQLVSD